MQILKFLINAQIFGEADTADYVISFKIVKVIGGTESDITNGLEQQLVTDGALIKYCLLVIMVTTKVVLRFKVICWIIRLTKPKFWYSYNLQAQSSS